MNKALPWNINGVGFDAREAAREAARRQGKSLGEWLHAVIADHAADLGVQARDVGEQERIDAVTARLERLGSGDGTYQRRRRTARVADVGVAQPTRASFGEDDAAGPRRVSRHETDAPREPRRGLRGASVDETEYLLEEAIDAIERRAERAERRTDTALADFAKLLESNEAKRDRERDAVRELTQKLSAIETHLTRQTEEPSIETPVQGALARLEARLETIARRTNAESTARLQSGRPLDERRSDVEPMRRLEEKLNTILDAVAHKPAPFAPTPAAGDPAAPRTRTRRLGDAIAEISRRQRALDGGTPNESPQPNPVFAPELQQDAPWQRALVAMQSDLSSLAVKIDEMRGAPRPPATPPAIDIDKLKAEVDAMARSVRALTPRGDVNQLQDSVDALTRRVERSREEGVREVALRPIEAALHDITAKVPGVDPRPILGRLEREVKTIAAKVDHLSDAHAPALSRIQTQMQEIRDLLSETASRPLVVETIERQVSALVERLDKLPIEPSSAQALAPAADRIRSLVAGLPGEDALEKIEARLEHLADRLDEAAQPQSSPSELAGLERLVRDLGDRIEAAQAPGADNRALDALQRQVEVLAERFEHSQTGLASLGNLERTMQDLFGQIEATRASVETSAAHAAREVLRIAVDDERGRDTKSSGTAALTAMQVEADKRTQSTLNAVHQTLEHVVGRMSAMEADLDMVRRTPPKIETRMPTSEAPKAPRRTGLDAPLGGLDSLSDPLFASLEPKPEIGRPRTERPRKPAAPAPTNDAVAGREEEAGRADFIAAARRAAKAAQRDPSVLALTRPAPADDNRASLLAKSRDYVATHKRPVLLSIAAVFVVLGTMAIVQRMTFNSADPDVASLEAPAKTVIAAAEPAAPVGMTSNDLSPSALPKGSRALSAQIPGSDPAPTSSIQTLPSFAAQGAASPRSAVPTGLIAAAEAGDGAAQYELASRYADGRTVTRDLKTAASWYQKAADQGLAPAQYRLAALYEKGLGVPQDKQRARSLYQSAADAGNPRAMHNLAVLLADGDGKPDYAAAATWFRKAAQYGIHDSQYNLAILLARGLGVDRSLVQSYQWFAIAAAHDDADAAKKRDDVGDRLAANDLAVAKALAASFQARTANAASTDVAPPPGGWDSLGPASHINSARSKISSL